MASAPVTRETHRPGRLAVKELALKDGRYLLIYAREAPRAVDA